MQSTSLFQQINPAFNNSFGGSWNADVLRFSLPVENSVHNTVRVEYFFYASPYSYAESELPLLEHVTLDESHCFGSIWAWETTLNSKCSKYTELQNLGYLIRITRSDSEKVSSSQWILDPYARASAGAEEWGQASVFQINPQNFSVSFQENLRIASLCAEARSTGKSPESLTQSLAHTLRRLPVIAPKITRAKPISRPKHLLEDSILYECHVRGMTQHASPENPVSDSHKGTYKGLQACIPHFKELGITTVELLPIFDFDECENPLNAPDGTPLLNYWGYSTLCFFAPKSSYAFDSNNPIQELMEMVDAFHEANIEVILDVVYNHTAELDVYGPTDHFKALAPKQWYLHNAEGTLSNYSGCGNTLNCSHPWVKQMIVDSLSYWAHEIGVDGFRFDLTSILDRNTEGAVNTFPQFLWELKENPAFSEIKLIAEPWDAAGAYQVGHFAFHIGWAEWNDRYRDALRKSVAGHEGMMESLKNALSGSPEIYQSLQQGRKCSVNFITAHDGFTLYDLVSYNHKHNDDNGEENRDGMNENHSQNCGAEGATNNVHIQELRFRKLRCFHLLLQCSSGIPMLTAGDELGRSQGGNNNAYSLDNVTTWISWDLKHKNHDLFAFVAQAIQFRKKHARFLFGEHAHYECFNSEGGHADYAPHVRTLVWNIESSDFPNQNICLLINCYHESLPFCFPKHSQWQVLLNSSQNLVSEAPFPHVSEGMDVDAFSVVVLFRGGTTLTS